MSSQNRLDQGRVEHDQRILLFRQAPLVDRSAKAPREGPSIRFESAEHRFLGDGIILHGIDDRQYTAFEQNFTLPNGVVATYGQINALAGDFYGTDKPISDGKTFEERCLRFRIAWDTLAIDRIRQPREANAILAILDIEVKAIEEAFRNHQDPSIIYSRLETTQTNLALQWETADRPSGHPDYLGLAEINWDHFGNDAHISYVIGHCVALEVAKKGDLLYAYAMNAFADHFLEDSFAAGHIRTPRRTLHRDGNIFYDLCARYMHDEENAIGLKVKNKRGDQWTMFGDKRLLDEVDSKNKEICKAGVQASADEIYAAWKTGSVPEPQSFAFLNLVPDLGDKALFDQELIPLFVDARSDCARRVRITDRRTPTHDQKWTAWATCATCEVSGWWNYPITIDGPNSGTSNTKESRKSKL